MHKTWHLDLINIQVLQRLVQSYLQTTSLRPSGKHSSFMGQAYLNVDQSVCFTLLQPA